jgi:hypothetical protein
MPFGNPSVDPHQAQKLEDIYSQWIKPCVESVEIPNSKGCKLTCHRADTETRPGDIIEHIVKNLVDADIVIADLSGRNPNVFYELGVRHAVGVGTILVADSLADIPFDLRTQRAIPYRYDPSGMLRFRDALRQAIHGILSSPASTDNPVRKFLYQREVAKLQSMTAPPGYDAVKEILTEVAGLRAELTKYASEMRAVIRTVSTPVPPVSAESHEAAELRKFEGVWRITPSGSLACARIVNGQLLIPYSYGGDRGLAAHYYNCRVIGESLFARFQWFEEAITGHRISGVGFYTLVGQDRLEGGWWGDAALPQAIRDDASRLSTSLPGMTNAVWVRTDSKAPPWAEEYFRKAADQLPKD